MPPLLEMSSAAFYNDQIKNVSSELPLKSIYLTGSQLPHMITPQMAELSWEFLRRFARDGNGRIVELQESK